MKRDRDRYRAPSSDAGWWDFEDRTEVGVQPLETGRLMFVMKHTPKETHQAYYAFINVATDADPEVAKELAVFSIAQQMLVKQSKSIPPPLVH